MKTIKKFIILLAVLCATCLAYSQPPNEFVNPKVDHFWVAINYDGQLVIDPPGMNGGAPIDDPGEDGQWYYYLQPPGVPWFNVWFYNDPLDMTRMKKIRIGFYITTLNPELPGALFYVVNWSTPAWDPPVPQFPTHDDEQYIMRSESNGPMSIPPLLPLPGLWVELFYEIPDYNPEWVSVDIFGQNILIKMQPIPPPLTSPLLPYWDGGPGGIIVHECLPKEVGVIPLSNWSLILTIGLIVLFTIFIWWRRRG